MLFTKITKFSFFKLTKTLSAAQSSLPKDIFNFTIQYINNSHHTRQNPTRWGLSLTSDCLKCLAPERLLHIVAGCQSYPERFTWRHDFILHFLATILQTIYGSSLYVDVPGYNCQCAFTGDMYRPDLLLSASTGTF